MLRIYFDSNIFRSLKKGKQYNEDLYNAVKPLKERFLFCFSDAHLDDLQKSKKEYRDEDLLLMEDYVLDNYFSYNPIEKKFDCLLATPTDAYANKDYKAYNDSLKNAFDFDDLFDGMENTPELMAIKNLFSSILEMPISVFGNEELNLLEIDKKNKAWLDKIVPNYNPSMSIRELIRSISPYTTALLNDKKQVTDVRRYLYENIDRDNYSYDKWGASFNEKFKETKMGKTFIDTIESMLMDNQKNDFYLKFTHAYTLLEMYNVTQEKNGQSVKKFDMTSLNTDASHVYYGSFCDYLVTNDNGMLEKAKITYQLFGVHTQVLSPQQFIDFSFHLRGNEETFHKFSTCFQHDLDKAFLLRKTNSIISGIQTSSYKTGHNYFNYFNRLQIIVKDGFHTYAFYCDRESHGDFFMYREIEMLINKLNEILGMDDEFKAEYKIEERNELSKEKCLRKWTRQNLLFSLSTAYKTFGNFIVLTLEMVE